VIYCLELIRFVVSNTSNYIEVENGMQGRAVMENDPGGPGKVVENF